MPHEEEVNLQNDRAVFGHPNPGWGVVPISLGGGKNDDSLSPHTHAPEPGLLVCVDSPGKLPFPGLEPIRASPQMLVGVHHGAFPDCLRGTIRDSHTIVNGNKEVGINQRTCALFYVYNLYFRNIFGAFYRKLGLGASGSFTPILIRRLGGVYFRGSLRKFLSNLVSDLLKIAGRGTPCAQCQEERKDPLHHSQRYPEVIYLLLDG
jgi:hypothetical protein